MTEPISPDHQFSRSVLYLPRPLVIIPTPSGDFHIYEGYSGGRTFVASVPPAELPAWLAADFAESEARRAAPPKPAPRQRSHFLALDDIDLGL